MPSYPPTTYAVEVPLADVVVATAKSDRGAGNCPAVVPVAGLVGAAAVVGVVVAPGAAAVAGAFVGAAAVGGVGIDCTVATVLGDPPPST